MGYNFKPTLGWPLSPPIDHEPRWMGCVQLEKDAEQECHGKISVYMVKSGAQLLGFIYELISLHCVCSLP